MTLGFHDLEVIGGLIERFSPSHSMAEQIKEPGKRKTMDIAKYMQFSQKFGCEGVERAMKRGFHLFVICFEVEEKICKDA